MSRTAEELQQAEERCVESTEDVKTTDSSVCLPTISRSSDKSTSGFAWESEKNGLYIPHRAKGAEKHPENNRLVSNGQGRLGGENCNV